MTHLQPLKFYTSPGAVSPARVQFYAEEKNLSFERVVVNLMAGEHKTPAFRAISPNGRVPALEVSPGVVLCESSAIMRYLEALYPENPLLGRNPLEQSQVEMWDRMMELELLLPMAMTFRHTFPAMKALEDQMPEFGNKQRTVALSRMRRLDRELAGKTYILGDYFCAADITAWCALRFFRVAGFDIPAEMPDLSAWYQRIKARPAAAAAFK